MLRFLAFFLYMVQQVAAQLSDRITDDEDQILEGSAADYQDYSGDLDEDLPKGRESVSFLSFLMQKILEVRKLTAFDSYHMYSVSLK